jgi:hypothetical protein
VCLLAFASVNGHPRGEMYRKLPLPFLVILLCFSTFPSFGQLWSGILAPGRAVDWTQAGFPGGTLPDSAWAQCATTACATVTAAGNSATVAQINSALASAPSNTYVQLASGTYRFTSPLIISDYGSEKSNVVLRGAGANSTFLVYSGTAAGGGCYNSVISLEGNCTYVNGGEENVCVFAGSSTTSTVTAGTYAQGSTYLSITNCGSSTPATGSLSNLKVGGIIMVDQLAETNDTGTIWNCAVSSTSGVPGCAGNGDGGGMRTNGPCNTTTTCERPQAQGFVVVGINGSVVQVDQPLYLSQWRTSQRPQAWFATNTVSTVGLENLSIDTTSATGFTSTIGLSACNKCWVAGVRSIDSNRSHIRILYDTHNVVRDNYLYKNQSGGSSSYGFEIAGGWDNLLENNITQQVTDSDPSCTGPCAGNVLDYNFDVDNAYSASNGYIVPPFFLHAGGDVMNLWEGNFGPGFSGDNIHGTHHFETVYRNTLPGWQSQCQGGACYAQTTPITLPAGDRYMNIVGNVLGQGGFHTTYQCSAQSSNTLCSAFYATNGKADVLIYSLNYVYNTYSVSYSFCNSLPAGSCTTTGGWDPQTSAYLMRWGNFDVVTGAARFCGNSSDTGWSTICSGTSEIPTSLPLYANAVPSYGDTGAGQAAMPASFYYASKPAFLGSTPWPVAGPDVTGGNLGNCSGGPYSGMAATSSSQCGSGGTLGVAWAGHANANAAMACYLNSMVGPADGTGNVLSFNVAACYPSGSIGSNPPAPPTSLSYTVQ